jgi:hypothetical protein
MQMALGADGTSCYLKDLSHEFKDCLLAICGAESAHLLDVSPMAATALPSVFLLVDSLERGFGDGDLCLLLNSVTETVDEALAVKKINESRRCHPRLCAVAPPQSRVCDAIFLLDRC